MSRIWQTLAIGFNRERTSAPGSMFCPVSMPSPIQVGDIYADTARVRTDIAHPEGAILRQILQQRNPDSPFFACRKFATRAFPSTSDEIAFTAAARP